jgi:hypothetical protein
MSVPGSPAGSSEAKLTPAQRLVAQLESTFREQIKRALGVELPDEVSGLAYVDHHLGELRSEDREPIVTLVACGAGAWFGEFVRKQIGGHWIGDGEDPRRLRLLLDPIFLHFSPVDLAYEAIFSGEVDEGDARAPDGPLIDGAYQLDGAPNPKGPANLPPEGDPEAKPEQPHDASSDREWVGARLAELAPVPQEQYFSMTGRFETLQLILQMLAHRRVADGKQPRTWSIEDYLQALGQS